MTEHYEPRWVCLEGMNRDELAAYDYGCDGMMDALQRILDGRDTGAGSCNEPWASLRNEVLALKRDAERYRWLRDNPWPPELVAVIQWQQNGKWDEAIDRVRNERSDSPTA